MTGVQNHRPDDPSVRIRTIVESDRADWVRMREALWPGSLSDHDEETRKHFDNPAPTLAVFVADAGGRAVAFLELDYRKYAPGCRSSPVPFIEAGLSNPDCSDAVSGKRLSKPPNHLRGRQDITRSQVTQRVTTRRQSLPISPWDTTKSNVSYVFGNRFFEARRLPLPARVDAARHRSSPSARRN
jgi:hypothetical protein